MELLDIRQRLARLRWRSPTSLRRLYAPSKPISTEIPPSRSSIQRGVGDEPDRQIERLDALAMRLERRS